MIDNFIFSLSSALPIFLVMAIGYGLKMKGIITDEFVKKANAIVFYVALPVKLFSDVFYSPLDAFADYRFIAFVVVGTLITIVVAWGVGYLAIKDRRQLGAFVQGAYRGNFLYIGLSLMENVMGRIGAKAPLAIALIVPLYNVSAVVILSVLSGSRETKIDYKGILKGILTNPMIIAVVLGMLGSTLNVELPIILERTVGYFEVLATPLALLTIGGSFKLGKLSKNLGPALIASFLKLILFPAIAVYTAVKMGFSSEDTMLLYIVFGVPTATISYVMTVVMKGDSDLASNIIMTTTLLANLSMTLFVFVMKSLGII
jgi:predicted permease